MITLENGAEVIAAKLNADTHKSETDRVYRVDTDREPYGVVLAVANNAEYVTWTVWRRDGVWHATSGHYYGTDFDAARDDFDNRAR